MNIHSSELRRGAIWHFDCKSCGTARVGADLGRRAAPRRRAQDHLIYEVRPAVQFTTHPPRDSSPLTTRSSSIFATSDGAVEELGRAEATIRRLLLRERLPDRGTAPGGSRRRGCWPRRCAPPPQVLQRRVERSWSSDSSTARSGEQARRAAAKPETLARALSSFGSSGRARAPSRTTAGARGEEGVRHITTSDRRPAPHRPPRRTDRVAAPPRRRSSPRRNGTRPRAGVGGDGHPARAA